MVHILSDSSVSVIADSFQAAISSTGQVINFATTYNLFYVYIFSMKLSEEMKPAIDTDNACIY